jgi:phosphomevalonate kinase
MLAESHGKVLILGGYLVLFPQYFGLVLTCSSKVRAILKPVQGEDFSVCVKSRQFNLSSEFKSSPFQALSESNVFILESLKTAFYFISQMNSIRPERLEIEVHGDEEFYTCGKTGLGSSAALSTSLVKVLMNYHGITDLALIHFVAQVSHFRAQEKIGSGFDVSAAVYGSILFRRHISALVPRLLDNLSVEQGELLEEVRKWPAPQQFRLPQGFQVVLCCNEQSGANTRILVRELLKWVEGNFGYFDQMQGFIQEFLKLVQEEKILELRELSRKVKELLKVISQLSTVEVLPEDVKIVMEKVEENLQDVVFSSVPGAGGYDAYYFIVFKRTWEEARDYLLSGFPDLKILNVRCGVFETLSNNAELI